MRRMLAAAVLALAWAGSAVGWQAAAGPELLFRARATSVAVHGFYDHEDLFPVSILDLSVPYAEASFEPGPSSQALGSFLWEPDAAELGTVFCILSEGQFCQFPDYPFRARASHPSAGDEEQPPTLTVEDPRSPVTFRGADQRARAGADGAGAEAGVARLEALPMTQEQAAAANRLRTVLSGISRARAPQDWVLAVRAATSESATDAAEGGMVASASARVREIRLLGGLIEIGLARGEATATAGGPAEGTASADAGRIRVGDLEAAIGPDGLRVTDQELGKQELAAATDAVNRALREFGMSIQPGRRQVRRTHDGVQSEAFAFSLEFRRTLLPEQFPEGARGADVLQVPVAFVHAEAAATEAPGFAGRVGKSGPRVAPAPAGGSGNLGGLGPLDTVPTDSPQPSATGPEAIPATPVLAIGIPTPAVIVVGLAALALVVGLTWLKVVEVLAE